MAPKADLKAETKELGAALGTARNKAINFALLIGKNGLVFESDPRKPANSLRTIAKKKGGAKGAWGAMRCEGSKLVLTCDEEPPSNLQKLAKKHFAERGQMLQLEFVKAAAEEDNDDEENSEINVDELLQKARKKPHNVAWLLGDKGLVLKAHPRHPVEKLRQQAKSEGGGPRGACGVLSISGKTLTLTCEEEPPKSFPRLAKVWMADQGHVYKVKVVLPGGGELDSDQDDEGTLSEESAQDAEPALSKEALTTDLKKIAEVFKPRFKSMPADQAKNMKTALKSVAVIIAKGDLVGAQNAMNKIALLSGVTADTPVGPTDETESAATDENGSGEWKAALAKEFATLKPELKQLLEIVIPENKTALQTLAQSFGEEMKSGAPGGSRDALDALKLKVDEIIKTRAEGQRLRMLEIAKAKERAMALREKLAQLEAENPQS